MLGAIRLDPKRRYVANWLKRRGYVLQNWSEADGGIEWWELLTDDRRHSESNVCVTVTNFSPLYEAVFRPEEDSDVHVRIYLRDLGTKAAQHRLMEFEAIQKRLGRSLSRMKPP